jgi:hypothetical protein
MEETHKSTAKRNINYSLGMRGNHISNLLSNKYPKKYAKKYRRCGLGLCFCKFIGNSMQSNDGK